MNIHRFFSLLIVIALPITILCQDNQGVGLDSFSRNLVNSLRSQESPRTILVTDKYVYGNDNSIWFNVFFINAVSQRMTPKAKFLFVDLVNEKDSVVQWLITDAANRQLSSRMVLPDSLPSGNYWLRAYTRQMPQLDSNSIAVKPIYIIGREKASLISSYKKKLASDKSPVIHFFPEGGSIITGVNSVVGLQVTDQNGLPLIMKGEIRDNRDTIIGGFTTDNRGLAKFGFEPSGRRRYRAIINWQGKDLSFPLPAFDFYKGQLALTKQSSGYKLTVLLGDSIFSKDMQTYVIGIARDSLFFASIGSGQYEVNVPDQNIPAGIASFYLLDKSFNLLSERSVYVHDKNLLVNIQTDKSTYQRRDKVMLNIGITDAAQHVIPTLLSISVIDSTFSDPSGPCTQSSWIPDINELATTATDCVSENDMDLLMLTHTNSYPGTQKIIKMINPTTDSLLWVKGKLLNDKDQPVIGKPLTLLSNSGNFIFHSDTTDKTGRFYFALENYPDKTEFGLEGLNGSGRNTNNRIVMDKFDYPFLSTPSMLKKYPLNGLRPVISARYALGLNDSDKQLLPRVTVRDAKKAKNYDETKRVSTNSSIITSSDIGEGSAVGNAILNVAGLHLLMGFLVINGPTSLKTPDASSEPIVIENGVQVTVSSDMIGQSPTLNYLNGLNGKDIDFIEILKGSEGANYGLRGGNGVILVNLSNVRKNVNTGSSNVQTFIAKGIAPTVIFPNKNFDSKEDRTSLKPDNRSTLYWSGNVWRDATHNESLSFYTNDLSTTYRVIVTGVTIYGDIIYKTITFRTN